MLPPPLLLQLAAATAVVIISTVTALLFLAPRAVSFVFLEAIELCERTADWVWLRYVRATGQWVPKRYVLDPLFHIAIGGQNYKLRIIGASMWRTAPSFAEKLLTVCGVCVHPSLVEGECRPDERMLGTRDELVAAYADLCLAVAPPFIRRRLYPKVVLTRAMLLPHQQLLPAGWRMIVSEEEWRRCKEIYAEREVRTRAQLNLYYRNTVYAHIRRSYRVVGTDYVPSFVSDSSSVVPVATGGGKKKEDQEPLICPICLEPPKDVWVALHGCNHAFHEECVLRLQKEVCPVCRREMTVVLA